MESIIVVDNLKKWPLEIPDVPIISAKTYLTDTMYLELKHIKIFNLSNSYSYQSEGYYTSLIASARGHKTIPSIETIQVMKSLSIVRMLSDELDNLIQSSLRSIQSDKFLLSIYFGKNTAKKYDRLSSKLFNLFQIPFMRVEFRRENDKWITHNVKGISANEIYPEHFPFVIETATKFFQTNNLKNNKREVPKYNLGILYDPHDKLPPSNKSALQKFEKAARKLDMSVEFIKKNDYSNISKFDALFIRETTQVNHHTYRFSRRAEKEGLVVIDDPESIEKCSNKVFLSELLTRHKIRQPKTLVVHSDNIKDIIPSVGLPCILKIPDSSFSQGVFKITNEDLLYSMTKKLLLQSDLILAQEFLYTDFDWRVGIIDGEVLYVCKYFMAHKHWKIIKNVNNGKIYEGKGACLKVDEAPKNVITTAIRAANLIGNGLYGVDLKQVGKKVYVIEINDNPSIDAGMEDKILKNKLYLKIMSVILNRIEKSKFKKNNNHNLELN